MENSSDSVYNLLGELCETFGIKSERLKPLRARCYEVLLRKKLYQNPRKFKDVPGVSEATVNALSWCYNLIHQYDYQEHAERLQSCTDELRHLYGDDYEGFNRILTFLLCLKDIPKKDSNILDLSLRPEIDEELAKYKNLIKHTVPHTPSAETVSSSITHYKSIETSTALVIKDEGYSSPQKESIWDIAARLELSPRRNWESYGLGPPARENPFLSELGELSSLWVDNLESLYMANNYFSSFTVLNSKMKPRPLFIKELKYLLMGMQSETFNLSCQQEFFISPSIRVEGITADALERFCSSFLFSGTCYRALNNMATPNLQTRRYFHNGYIFTEFCNSLAKYLQFYRTAIFSIPDETHYLTFYKKTEALQTQIATIASICKAGPYSSEPIPHGVALLNYLYQKMIGLSDTRLCLVLCSIFYPCCQVYFSRFLHQWLIKGTLNDPNGEFFIAPNVKYLNTRGRTYWTRSYIIYQDLIPEFMSDLIEEILFCGRIMNLLHLCHPTNALCNYSSVENPLIISCCLTPEKLNEQEQGASVYYLKSSEKCGTKFSFARYLEKSREVDVGYRQLIAKKRALTLRRIELERQQVVQENRERKLEELLMLKEQYEAALEEKQIAIYKDIENEIKTMKEDLRIEEMREKLIEEEATKMIDYYSELCDAVEDRQQKIVNHIKSSNVLYMDTASIKSDNMMIEEKVNSSTESFYSAPEDERAASSGSEFAEALPQETIRSSKSLDVINANVPEEKTQLQATSTDNVNETTEKLNPAIQQALDNFEFAKRIKMKVLNQEMGITVPADNQIKRKTVKEVATTSHLTEAQRNKLKVLSTEFGMNILKDEVKSGKILTLAQINRNRIMGHDTCFTPNYGEKPLDNECFVNRNHQQGVSLTSSDVSKPPSISKSVSLQLDLEKISVKSDSDKLMPMSVDSTPMSDLLHLYTPSTEMFSCTTPSSTADVLPSQEILTTSSSILESLKPTPSIPTFSKRVTIEEAKGICRNSLKQFLNQSVSIPLLTQLKLVNNEILKYFIEELHYFDHLASLRDYFFLQDGEFGRNITENLYEKLYNANFPLELINLRTLQHLVFSALDSSGKFQENSQYLSFRINSLPKCFDLGDPNVLECLSLTYKVNWPLNILLPTDAVAKYDEIFKFLVKLTRVSWVLKKELKILAKESGKKEIYLMSSPQYRQLHKHRHVMSHFVVTFQNYIVGEVLQPSWDILEKSLRQVKHLDELYTAHSIYIKDILFRCMLNQKSAALRSIIHKTFVVILKFYDYLRSRQWKCEEGVYVHPNFSKLERIYQNFDEFIMYFFKVARKVVRSGYHPHLTQFLDVLDVNDYYSKKLQETAGAKKADLNLVESINRNLREQRLFK